MRKHLISIALFSIASSAFATGPIFGGDTTNNYDQRTYNQGGQGGSGTASATAGASAAAGAAAAVLGSGNSHVDSSLSNRNTLTGNNSQDQGQQQQQQNQQQQSFQGNSSGNNTSMVVERSAPAVAVGAQTAPVVDCRRTLGVGASSPGGSGVVSGIPLWKESDCEGVMAVQVMDRAGFSTADIQAAACTIERVAQSKTCERIRQEEADRKHALAVLSN